ncbi:MAG: SGNH/GDSL hydrolase family protein [Candidatus Krumholzibacteria bacterium]|nr:SGNH/GDSL hydrolase family protein [Candidatus Krumholzibacteria bacterium]
MMRKRLANATLLGILIFSAAALAADPEANYPDPRRFAVDVEAFTAQEQIAAPPQDAVLCIGSSSLRFWHDTISDDLQPLTLIPRGFGGSTMLDVLHYSAQIVVPYQPRAILLYEGDNDIHFGVSPARFLATVQQFLELIHATKPETRIYFLAVKPSPSRWDLWPQMQEANILLQQLCTGDPLLTFIDIATPMLGDDGRPRPELFLADDLHMNEKGYEIWRQEVRRVMVDREAAFE